MRTPTLAVFLLANLACSTTPTTSGVSSGSGRHTTGVSGSVSSGSVSGNSGSGATSGGISGTSGSGGTSGSTSGASGSTSGTPVCSVTCQGLTPYCVNGICEECRTGGDCMSSYPYCVSDTTTTYFGHCVQCLVDTDCSGGICDPVTFLCKSDCRTAGACDSGYCEGDSGACVECLANAECPNAGEVCVDFTCGGCFHDADCNPDSGLPYCGPEQRCAQCFCPTDAGLGGTEPCAISTSICASGMCVSGDFTCQ